MPPSGVSEDMKNMNKKTEDLEEQIKDEGLIRQIYLDPDSGELSLPTELYDRIKAIDDDPWEIVCKWLREAIAKCQ